MVMAIKSLHIKLATSIYSLESSHTLWKPETGLKSCTHSAELHWNSEISKSRTCNCEQFLDRWRLTRVLVFPLFTEQIRLSPLVDLHIIFQDYRVPWFLWRERSLKGRSPYPHCEQWRTHREMPGCNLGSQQLENRHTAPCKDICNCHIDASRRKKVRESRSCFVKLELPVN